MGSGTVINCERIEIIIRTDTNIAAHFFMQIIIPCFILLLPTLGIILWAVFSVKLLPAKCEYAMSKSELRSRVAEGDITRKEMMDELARGDGSVQSE